VVCACLLPAAVLVADPSGYSPFGPSKWAAITVVALTAVAVTAWGRKLRVAKWPTAVWLLFLGWLIVAAIVGLDPLYAWIGTPDRHFGVLTWVLCFLLFGCGQSLDDEGDARLVVGAVVAAAGLAGAWALAEKLGWHATAVDAGSRLIGSMGSAAYLGAAMALLVPITIGVALDRSWARRSRIAAVAAAALAMVALIGSGARAAWVGTIVGAAIVLIAHWHRVRARPGRAALVAGAMVVAVLGLGAATGVAGRVPSLFDRGGAGGSSRLDEWTVASKVLAHHPVTGVGPEGYRIALPQGLDAHYVEAYGLTPLPDRAHDSVLDVAVTTGLPGVATYLVLLGLVGAVVIAAVRRAPLWLAGVAVGLTAYAAQGLALFPLAELEPAAWLLAGVVLAHTARAGQHDDRRASADHHDAHTARAEQSVELRVPRVVAVVAAGMAVVALVAGGRDVAADRDTRTALAMLAQGNGPVAQRDAQRATALRPDQIEYWLAAEQADAAPDTPSALQRGLDDLTKGLSFSPRDPVLLDARGELLLERAQRSGTRADLLAARTDLAGLIARDPFDAQDQLRLGVAAAQLGDPAGAEQAWLAADRLAPTSASAATDLAMLYAGQSRWAQAASAARQALARDPSDSEAQAVLAQTARHLGT